MKKVHHYTNAIVWDIDTITEESGGSIPEVQKLHQHTLPSQQLNLRDSVEMMDMRVVEKMIS